MKNPNIAILIPAYNEDITIKEVITSFAKELTSSKIYVYDNGSNDCTAEYARNAGAIVRTELHKGKGNVVRRMFADIEADLYILVDADATYDPSICKNMLTALIDGNLDMITAIREPVSSNAFRPGHRTGNFILSWLISALFGRHFSDVLSGYRAFSKRFVKSFPCFSKGFEIETELTVHALEMRMPIAEIAVKYKSRPDQSESKLRTYQDGIKIIRTILSLLRAARPFLFFGIIACILAIISIIIFYPILNTYLETGLVPRFPTAIASALLMLSAAVSMTSGIILHYITRTRLEMKMLHYLSISPMPNDRD